MKIKFTKRSKDAPHGRFGGGWQYVAGVQIGGRTMILNCVTFSIRLDWPRP